ANSAQKNKEQEWLRTSAPEHDLSRLQEALGEIALSLQPNTHIHDAQPQGIMSQTVLLSWDSRYKSIICYLFRRGREKEMFRVGALIPFSGLCLCDSNHISSQQSSSAAVMRPSCR